MAGDIEVLVDLTAKGVQDVKKQLGDIDKKLGKVKQSADKSVSGFDKMKNAIGAVGAAFAAFKGLEVLTNAAKEQEKAVNRLNVALRTSGDFSQKASDDMQKFASDLQKMSTVGDEVALNQLALAKSFGATNEQAKQIVAAAADMSAALGIDLESATRNVAKTLGGFAGELGEAIPELKDLGKEALQSGEGIELLSARFKGSAEGELNTYDGAIAQLKNSFGDLLEEFGGFIVKSDSVRKAARSLAKTFGEIGKTVNETRKAVSGWIDDIIDVVSGNQDLDRQLEATGFTIVDSTTKATQAIDQQTEAIVKNMGASKKNADEAKKNADEKKKAFEAEEKAFFDLAKKLQAAERKRVETRMGQVGAGISAIQQGGAGAGRLLAAGAGAAANAFFPGAGAIAQPLTELLGQNEEQMRQQIRAFARGAVVFIENVVKNIPVLIEELANAMPMVVQALAEKTDEIIIALARGMPKASLALAEALAIEVPLALIKEIPNVGKALVDEMVSGAGRFIDALIEELTGALKKAGGAAGGILGNIPIVGDVLGGVGGAVADIPVVGDVFGGFGFHRGGVVPGVGNTDSVPAMLTPGEGVVNTDTMAKLDMFLSSPQVIRTEVKLNEKAFADILIELDRTGSRTSTLDSTFINEVAEGLALGGLGGF